MTPLAAILRADIRRNGPMRLSAFMSRCLGDPAHGFYQSLSPVGAQGAFITAPEVSQIFGELIGLWLVQTWRDQGRPGSFSLVELGPGRGVLMADALRAAKVDPEFSEAARLFLLDFSVSLTAAQAKRLASYHPTAIENLEQLPQAPLFAIANEFFDALPVSQWRFNAGVWRPRVVNVDSTGCLSFAFGAPEVPPANIVARYANPSDGAWIETRLEDEVYLEPLKARIVGQGGAALIIDYGYTDAERREAHGQETLQAVINHRKVSPLQSPGLADLTAHVNFDDLSALSLPLKSWGPVNQGSFLRRLGAEARAASLARSSPMRTDEIAAGLHRLTHPKEMGRLFRVLALTPSNAPTPAGFEP